MQNIELKYQKLLNRKINGSNKQVEKALSLMIKKLEVLLSSTAFHSLNNKNFVSELAKIRREFTNDMMNILSKYEKQVHSLSERKNIEQIFFATGTKLSNDILKKYLGELSVNIKSVSGRVWKISERFYADLKLILNSGVMQGSSAHEIKIQLTRLLNNPQNLDINELRRQGFVRAGGEEKYRILEKKILERKVGRGIYRSAKKNAFRLARTEINMAYRRRDNEIRKNIPFITGIEVKLSDSHPREDICDDMKGVYPKDFSFIGWHPACICYAVPIIPNKSIVREVINGNNKNLKVVKKMPSRAENYLKKKNNAIKRQKTLPYFVKENKKYIKIT